MTGIVAGSLILKETEKAKREAFLNGKKAAQPTKIGEMPGLTAPKVETHWVEGRVQGNRYVEGHYEYVIIEPTRWDVK